MANASRQPKLISVGGTAAPPKPVVAVNQPVTMVARPEGDSPIEFERRSLEDAHIAAECHSASLGGESALTNAGLASEDDGIPAPVHKLVHEPAEAGQLRLTADRGRTDDRSLERRHLLL